MTDHKSNDSPEGPKRFDSNMEQLQAKAEGKELKEITPTEIEQHTSAKRRAQFVEPKERKSSGITKDGFPSTESLNPEEANTLNELKSATAEGLLIGTGGTFEKQTKACQYRDIDSELRLFTEQAIRQGASPALFGAGESPTLVAAKDKTGLDLEKSTGEAYRADSFNHDEARVAQMMPPDDALHDIKKVGHEGAVLGIGIVHGSVNFIENSLAGAGDLIRMAGAAHRKSNPITALIPDSDPEGTRKLHDACESISLGSRILLQYSTTLNPDSPFSGKDFDPEARKLAVRFAETMPSKLKEEIARFEKGTTEEKAATSTELALNIITLAETGEFAIGKTAQVAKESKLISNFNKDMHVLASKLKELQKDQLDSLANFVGDRCRIEPRLAYDGPTINSKALEQKHANDHVMEMRQHRSDDSNGRSSKGSRFEKVESEKVDRPKPIRLDVLSEHPTVRQLLENVSKTGRLDARDCHKVTDVIRESSRSQCLDIDERNIAFAVVQREGKQELLWSIHGPSEGNKRVPGLPVPENPILKPYHSGAQLRDRDSEFKILNKIASHFESSNTKINAKILLYSEQKPCSRSCEKVVNDFKSMFKRKGHEIEFPLPTYSYEDSYQRVQKMLDRYRQ